MISNRNFMSLLDSIDSMRAGDEYFNQSYHLKMLLNRSKFHLRLTQQV